VASKRGAGFGLTTLGFVSNRNNIAGQVKNHSVYLLHTPLMSIACAIDESYIAKTSPIAKSLLNSFQAY
jgi:hypothetical protein